MLIESSIRIDGKIITITQKVEPDAAKAGSTAASASASGATGVTGKGEIKAVEVEPHATEPLVSRHEVSATKPPAQISEAESAEATASNTDAQSTRSAHNTIVAQVPGATVVIGPTIVILSGARDKLGGGDPPNTGTDN